MLNSLPELPSSEAALLSRLEKEWERRQSFNRLAEYRPYPKQREFHAAGREHRERLLMAANQVGKTIAAGAEVAMHLTNRYPSWWQGYEAAHPEPWWAGGVTGESTRDNPQRILLGRIGCHGTGMIPKDAIKDINPRRGVPDAVDTVIVKWGGGGDVQAGECQVGFKSYDQGREKWQGETLGGVWYDEEPPLPIYMEGLTRTNVGLKPNLITFTPLMGMTDVVRRYLLEKVLGTHVTSMTIFDAEHYTPEQRAAIIATYPEHERKARTQGIPQMGSGRVFPFDRNQIECASFAIPDHWPQICGVDFGWDHPSAGARLAWDRDSDCIYVMAAHRAKAQTPMLFAAATKPWGDWLPWSWPHDGKQSGGKFDAADQQQLQAIYKKHGLKMLFQHAQFEDGTNGVEAGITDMYERMETGRWKVFSHLADWFEEFELYHRKDGLIVKLNDDLISASRYALMMKRYAISRPRARPIEINVGDRRVGGDHGWMG
ncbi:MAG TPA: terminase family protein [Acidobacteriaceae bacterium]|jgi:phage terminase large subunit-like protein